MRRMRTRIAVLAGLMVVMWVCGCGSDVGEHVSLKKVKAECRELKVEQLKERAAAYRDLLIAKQDQFKEAEEKFAAADPEITDEETLEQLKKDRKAVEKSRAALAERLGEYLDALRRKGVDISEFRATGNEEIPLPIPPID